MSTVNSKKGQKGKAVTRICSVKKVFLEISQNSQQNTCARVSFLISLQANTFSYRTPLVAASEKGIRKNLQINLQESLLQIYCLLLFNVDSLLLQSAIFAIQFFFTD